MFSAKMRLSMTNQTKWLSRRQNLFRGLLCGLFWFAFVVFFRFLPSSYRSWFNSKMHRTHGYHLLGTPLYPLPRSAPDELFIFLICLLMVRRSSENTPLPPIWPRVRLPDLASHAGWVCWLPTRGFSLGTLVSPYPQKETYKLTSV